MLTIHKQSWLDVTRYLIFNEQGSVMLDIIHNTANYNTDTYIWGLWVEPEHRGKGLATALMNAAEEIARREGRKEVTLDWHPKEAPKEVYDWYLRRGYEEQSTRNKAKRMRLKLR